MMITRIRARFVVCPETRRSGHILTSRGTQGEEFTSIDGALDSIEALRQAGEISRREALRLKDEINDLDIVFEEDEMLDKLFAEEGEGIPPGEFGEALLEALSEFDSEEGRDRNRH